MLYQMLAIVIWSSSFVAAKYAYEMLDAALMVQARFVIAALIVLPTCRRHLGKIPKNQWKNLIFLSFINYVLVLMLQFMGVKYTSAASATTIVGLEPILMVLLGHFFFGDKAKWWDWLCGTIAFMGVGLLVWGGHGEGGSVDLFGCVLVLLAGLFFCAAYRPTQKLIAEIGAPAYTSVSLVLAAILCVPFSLGLAENLSVNWQAKGVFSLLYLGVGCSWFAYWLWNKGMSGAQANVSGLLIALEPVFGVILAMLLLGERLSLVSGVGMVLIIGATLSMAILHQRGTKSASEK
ncbi:DMT family transporter [Alysiella filiformis]|uniref:DMT family transporter n=1 Tax=Alysiella filiformis TaxID=194196 RepID=UPI000BE2EB3A|nr:EamA family transporter [Alysiella filiformis]QMT32461.1 EamA family transporter [Alysiella filiformis]UBQ57314.1 EamA family transporter [Alysiella filiformis DSM 16848]